MKKFCRILTFCLFILFLVSYILLRPFSASFATAEGENRDLAERPAFSLSAYEEFSSAYEAYFNDYIPFRVQLNSLFADIKLTIFSTSPSSSVLLGDDNWLFYDSQYANDGDTMADYVGEKRYSEDELQAIAEHLNSMNNYCAEYDVPMIFLVCPNKSLIYSEYMPNSYIRHSTFNQTEQLMDYLQENVDIPSLYLRDELLKYKDKYQLYYKTDTHWNLIGGYLGAKECLSLVGIEVDDIDEKYIETSMFKGDLYNMLGCTVNYSDLEFNFTDEVSSHITVSRPYGDNSYSEYRTQAQGDMKLLIIGDSFSESMIPTLGRYFSEIDVDRNQRFQLLAEKDYDLVIYEKVERYVPHILGS